MPHSKEDLTADEISRLRLALRDGGKISVIETNERPPTYLKLLSLGYFAVGERLSDGPPHRWLQSYVVTALGAQRAKLQTPG